MREIRVENYLKLRVEALGGEVRKLRFVGHRGAPDRLVLLPSVDRFGGLAARHVLAEIKKPGEEAEAHQLREHEKLRSYGFTVVVLDSIEAIDAFLEGV